MLFPDEKIEELVVDILERISSGSPVSMAFYEENSRFKRDPIILRLKEASKLLEAEVYYDDRIKLWTTRRPNFLEYSPLTPEEAVALAGIKRNADHYGATLSRTVHYIANFFKRRRYAAKLQNYSVENFKSFMPITTIIDTAIYRGQYLDIEYNSGEEVKIRTVTPLRIANVEYYWYLIAIEKGKTEKQDIRHYALHYIEKIALNDLVFDPYFHQRMRNLVRQSHLGMNAYYKPYNDAKRVVIMIPEDFLHFLERSPFFKLWEIGKQHDSVTIQVADEGEEKEICFRKVHVPSTDAEYRDIIPTIQKYMPQFIVPDIQDNKELILHLRRGSENYAIKKQKLDEVL